MVVRKTFLNLPLNSLCGVCCKRTCRGTAEGVEIELSKLLEACLTFQCVTPSYRLNNTVQTLRTMRSIRDVEEFLARGRIRAEDAAGYGGHHTAPGFFDPPHGHAQVLSLQPHSYPNG